MAEGEECWPWVEDRSGFDSIADMLEEDEIQVQRAEIRHVLEGSKPKSSKKYIYSSSLIDISKLSRNGGIHRPIPLVCRFVFISDCTIRVL